MGSTTIQVLPNGTSIAVYGAEIVEAAKVAAINAASEAADDAATATGASATAVAARDTTVAARDVATAARDVTVAARDVAVAAQGTASAAATTATTQAGIATTQAGISTTAALQAASTPIGNSATTLTIGTGSKSLTVEANKAFASGGFVVISKTATPGDYMYGQVTSYNPTTGALVVNVSETSGSGTATAWTVALAGAKLSLGQSAVLAGPTISGGSGLSKPLDMAAPAPLLDSTGLNNSVGCGWQFNIGLFPDGPVARPNYYDATMNIGLNFDGVNRNLNLSMAAVGIGIETLYYNPGQVAATETHFRVIPKDTRNELRWGTNYGPELQSDWTESSNTAWRAASTNFTDGAGNTRVVFDFRTAVNQIQLSGATIGGTYRGAPQITFADNNRAPLTVRNAANSAFVEAFRYNADNRMVFNHALNQQITALGGGVHGVGTNCIDTAFTFAASSGIGHYRRVTGGTAQTVQWDDSILTGVAQYLYRNIGTGAVVMTLHGINCALSFETSAGGSTGPQIRHNTATDTLEIQAGGYRGGAAATAGINIARATGQATFFYPPKKPVYTLAGLPSAVTAGAGAEGMCSNETGGFTPVFSDGTNWRRVSDRAIAA